MAYMSNTNKGAFKRKTDPNINNEALERKTEIDRIKNLHKEVEYIWEKFLKYKKSRIRLSPTKVVEEDFKIKTLNMYLQTLLDYEGNNIRTFKEMLKDVLNGKLTKTYVFWQNHYMSYQQRRYLSLLIDELALSIGTDIKVQHIHEYSKKDFITALEHSLERPAIITFGNKQMDEYSVKEIVEQALFKKLENNKDLELIELTYIDDLGIFEFTSLLSDGYLEELKAFAE